MISKACKVPPEKKKVAITAPGLLRTGWPLLVLGLVSLYLAAMAIALTPVRVMHSYVMTTVEPQAVAGALRTVAGDALYQNYTNTRPLVPITYGALTYILPGTAARILGQTDVPGVLFIGRAMSVLFAILLPILLLVACRQRNVPRQWAWLSLLPLVWFPILAENWSKYLPHHSALACSVLGLVLLNRPYPASRIRQLVRALSAVIAWTIGFFFHPAVLIGPIAYVIERYALSRAAQDRKWRIFPWMILAPPAGYAAVSLLVAGIVNSQTGGLWYQNTVEAMTVCRYDLRYVLAGLDRLKAPGLLLLGSMILTAITFIRLTPLFAAYLVALVIELLLMTKQGSSASYLAGSTTLWGVGFATAAFRTNQHLSLDSPRLDQRHWLFQSFAGILLVGAVWTVPMASTQHWEIPVPSTEEAAGITAILNSKSAATPLFLDAFYAQLHKRPYAYADGYHAALLAAHGTADFGKIERALRAREHDVVVANVLYLGPHSYHDSPAVPEGIRSALRENYRIVAVGNWLAALQRE